MVISVPLVFCDTDHQSGVAIIRIPYRTRNVHAPIKYAICTFTLAKVHVAYFISANYGFCTNPLEQQWVFSTIGLSLPLVLQT